jgi:hypothetical protein
MPKTMPHPAEIRYGRVTVVKKGERMSVNLDDGSGAIGVGAPEDGIVVDGFGESMFVSLDALNQAMINHDAPRSPGVPMCEPIDLAEEEPYFQCEHNAVYRCGCETETEFKFYTRNRYAEWERARSTAEVGIVFRHALKIGDREDPVPPDWPEGWRRGFCSECGQVITMVSSEAVE